MENFKFEIKDKLLMIEFEEKIVHNLITQKTSFKTGALIKQGVFVKHKCPPIIANSKEGQGHKDKYLDTSRLILSQEILMSNMKALIFII